MVLIISDYVDDIGLALEVCSHLKGMENTLYLSECGLTSILLLDDMIGEEYSDYTLGDVVVILNM